VRHHLLARRVLAGIALSGLLSAATTGAAWVTAADPHPALPGPPGVARWRGAVAATAPGRPAPDPASARPAQVRRFFATLTERQRLEFTRRAPGVVGNLDGVPYRLRYAANELARREDDPHGPRPPGRLLGYDPRGDGRVVQVFGDLGSAAEAAVLVPGSGWDLPKLLAGTGRRGADPIAAARALLGEVRRLDRAARVAVVVWLGYDAPEGVDRQVMRSERAAAGAAALARFVEGLAPTRVSLLCHSYGAVVCGRALAAGAKADQVVALAAPGMGARSAGELGGAARLWAARIADDPIRFVPDVTVGGFGHGADPTTPGFGARVFATGAASGHDGYYAPATESLGNLARIVLHRPSEVTLVDHPR
jgi:Alpha/beta hydrolase